MGRGGSNSLWSPGMRGCGAGVEANVANRDVVLGCAYLAQGDQLTR